ncbi:hypothetical protein N499_0211A, partial [Wolbachia pipientis wVitA]
MSSSFKVKAKPLIKVTRLHSVIFSK